MKKGQNLKIMFTFIILIAKKRHFIEKYDIYNKKKMPFCIIKRGNGRIV